MLTTFVFRCIVMLAKERVSNNTVELCKSLQQQDATREETPRTFLKLACTPGASCNGYAYSSPGHFGGLMGEMPPASDPSDMALPHPLARRERSAQIKNKAVARLLTAALWEGLLPSWSPPLCINIHTYIHTWLKATSAQGGRP